MADPHHLQLNANENVYGAPQQVTDNIAKTMHWVCPDPTLAKLREAIAGLHADIGVTVENVVTGHADPPPSAFLQHPRGIGIAGVWRGRWRAEGVRVACIPCQSTGSWAPLRLSVPVCPDPASLLGRSRTPVQRLTPHRTADPSSAGGWAGVGGR